MSQSHTSTRKFPRPTPQEYAALVKAVGHSAGAVMEAAETDDEHLVAHLKKCVHDVVRFSDLLVREDAQLAEDFWEVYRNFVIWKRCPENPRAAGEL